MPDSPSNRPTTPTQLLARLAELDIPAKTQSHAPVMTVDESKRLRGEIEGAHCKNLFLKDKKQRLWLVVADEGRAINLKHLRRLIGSASLSFGRAELLADVLGVKPGSVTPFAVINDTRNQVTLVLDKALVQGGKVSFHPLTNTQTTTLDSAGLLAFLKAHEHEPLIIDFDVEHA